MTVKNHQFWIFYFAAWLIYAVCLGSVLLSVGNTLNLSLLLTILCNVAPGALLGFLVVQICRRLPWSATRQLSRFVSIHILLLLSFAFLWCSANLVFLSIFSSVQRGSWIFIRWDNFALLWQLLNGATIYLAVVSAVYVRQINENLRIEERRNAELVVRAARAEAAQVSAELFALRSQLNPHFLFNTLHSLMALVRADANAAEAAIERFALMLRYVLQSQNETRATTDVRFADEWNFVQNYLELERLRLGKRLRLTTDIEPAANEYFLPAFTIQPLIENAVKHAIAPRADGGNLTISARVEKENLVVKISDDGKPLHSTAEKSNNGLGLKLVRESLATRFGDRASLRTKNVDGFTALITIPRADFDSRRRNDSTETEG